MCISHIQVLSKERSLELFAEYPEDYTTICTNLMLVTIFIVNSLLIVLCNMTTRLNLENISVARNLTSPSKGALFLVKFLENQRYVILHSKYSSNVTFEK